MILCSQAFHGVTFLFCKHFMLRNMTSFGMPGAFGRRLPRKKGTFYFFRFVPGGQVQIVRCRPTWTRCPKESMKPGSSVLPAKSIVRVAGPFRLDSFSRDLVAVIFPSRTAPAPAEGCLSSIVRTMPPCRIRSACWARMRGDWEQRIYNAARAKATPIRDIGKTPAAKNHHRSRNLMTLSQKMCGYWPRVGLPL